MIRPFQQISVQIQTKVYSARQSRKEKTTAQSGNTCFGREQIQNYFHHISLLAITVSYMIVFQAPSTA